MLRCDPEIFIRIEVFGLHRSRQTKEVQVNEYEDRKEKMIKSYVYTKRADLVWQLNEGRNNLQLNKKIRMRENHLKS